MPFVPLSQRKAIPLVLDEDKSTLQLRQQVKDKASIDAHFGVAPGASGYRFANHPQTFGHVRGPDMPFRNATAPWRPPEVDPDGPARQRQKEQASYGAFWDASHGMKASHGSRSSPTLKTTANNLMEACHPLTAEITRWQEMGRMSEAETRKDIELKAPLVQPHPEPPKMGPNRQGLVLFPKYMLIHNCHLKLQDLQRFQKEQAATAQRTIDRESERAERASRRAATPSVGSQEERMSEVTPSVQSDIDAQAMGELTQGKVSFDPSWGAPLLREGGPQWAGSAMPVGGGHKHSNPFRMG